MASEFRAICATHSGHHNKSPKDQEQWARINASAPWEDRELTPRELADWITSGKAWTACHLKGRSHSQDNVVASNLIVLDVDGDLTLDAFWTIPAVQRHCLFTATSCSHADGAHRFRAVFACEIHEDVDLHGAIYDLWMERLGIQLKDNCGRKPERLWYGNDQTELRFGGGELIPWDLIEQARDNLKAARAARPRVQSPGSDDDLALDLRRAVYCLDHLLRPSVDGDFSGGYWKELLLAAAATGDENVQQAFLQWHHRGHHSRTQTQVKRRLQRSRSRMTAGEGAGKILKLTKEQHGEQWWELLPQELQYGSSRGTFKAPTVLMRSRSESDVAPFRTIWTPDITPTTSDLEHAEGPSVKPPTILGRARSFSDIAPQIAPHTPDTPPSTTEPDQSAAEEMRLPKSLMRSGSANNAAADGTSRVPDLVPSKEDLEKLAKTAKYTPLAPNHKSGNNNVPQPVTTTASGTQAPLTLDQKLRRLYFLRTHDLLQIGEDFRPVLPHEFTALDRELLGDLLSHPGYFRQPEEVERDLLKIFRQEHGFRSNPRAKVKVFKLNGRGKKQVRWLIPNFLIAGGEHVLYSKSGVGKTNLAMHMARAISGDPKIDHFLDSGPFSNHHLWKRSKIIFIGTDMHSEAEANTNGYINSNHFTDEEFLGQIDWLFEDQEEGSPAWELSLKDLSDFYEELESEHKKGTPVAAVFIDSMKAVCPDHLVVGNQAFRDYIELVKEICSKFSTALIWIHHARADGSGAQGIQRITEQSDANLYLKIDEKTNQMSLEIEKIRGGGKRRTLQINLFAPGGPRLTDASFASLADEGASRKDMVIKVLLEDFNRHRIRSSGSRPQWVENSYPGMKCAEIHDAIRQRFHGHPSLPSIRSLQRTIADLKETGRIVGMNRYRMSPHFQPSLADQGELTPPESPTGDDNNFEVPGW